MVYPLLGLDRWFPLKPIKKDDVQGELLVEIMMDEFTEEMYRGVITLVEARYAIVALFLNPFLLPSLPVI